MANIFTLSPYMNLQLPIPGLCSGPEYAIDLDSALTLVDAHTHIPGQGLPIPTLGINLDADLAFNSFNAITLRTTRFINQSAPLSLVTDLNEVYVVNGELFFNDGLGNQVQITLGGEVDVAGSGNIIGMGGTSAAVVYTNINHTFSFYSNTNTPAFMYMGPLTIGRNTANPFTVTIQPSASQPADYTLTLPPALPASLALLTVNTSGTESFTTPDNSTTSIVAGQLVANIPSGMLMPFAGSAIPSGWILCDGSAVSRTGTTAALFTSIGTMWGIGDGSTTFNLPDGRGMFLRGVSGASGNDPDAAFRTATNSGNSGNNIGSKQTSIFTSHTHTQDPHNHLQDAHSHSNAAHNHTQQAHSHSLGIRTTGPQGGSAVVQAGVATNADVQISTGSTTAVNNASAITIDATTATNQAATATNQSTGGAETRPINIYVNYLIKL